MITYVYICNTCRGAESKRTFEHTYRDMAEAEAAPAPPCPRCGGADVSRYFGHSFYGPASKSAVRDHAAPDRFVKLTPDHGKGILSVGMRLDPELMHKMARDIKELAERHDIPLVESQKKLPAPEPESEPEPEPDATNEPETDLTEEVLGLKKGSMDRTLFDIRQKQLEEDLKKGAPFSGFFMPLSGEYNN